jgi:hypothetical protein
VVAAARNAAFTSLVNADDLDSERQGVHQVPETP